VSLSRREKSERERGGWGDAVRKKRTSPRLKKGKGNMVKNPF
jgi:hypothetical protein